MDRTVHKTKSSKILNKNVCNHTIQLLSSLKDEAQHTTELPWNAIIYKQKLQIAYWNPKSSLQELIERGKSITVFQKNMQSLLTEIVVVETG